ncbi:hypothetical protein HAX54_042840 [Datura stramonium]|uniref:Uncharacterized protein n=1 Tax=Datura stramonium TaxID=4076 RepID=A0ABS8W2H7_DATST|nr:hypothetical protein [Datura stramonium]
MSAFSTTVLSLAHFKADHPGSSVEKETRIFHRSYVLGEKVLQESAVKLHPYLPEAVRSLGISINSYSEVVELIWTEALKGESDQCVNGASKSQVEKGPEQPCHEETSKCLPDTDCKVAASNGTVVNPVRPVIIPRHQSIMTLKSSLTMLLMMAKLVHPFLDPSANDGYGELAPHAAPERVAPYLDQPPNVLGKDDPKNKDDDRKDKDDAWISGERRSKGRILLKDRGEDTKKRSSSSTKCAISSGLYLSSGEEKAPIMTSIKRRQMEKNDQTCQNDEEFAALEEKHEKDNKKIVPARYRDKRHVSSVDESELSVGLCLLNHQRKQLCQNL